MNVSAIWTNILFKTIFRALHILIQFLHVLYEAPWDIHKLFWYYLIFAHICLQRNQIEFDQELSTLALHQLCLIFLN